MSAPLATHRIRFKQRQQGTILVQFALLAFVLIAILGTVQIGYMYYAKRDLQRIVDLAAIEATNALIYENPSSCTAAKEAGGKSVSAQLKLPRESTNEIPIIQCGKWDPRQADSNRFSASSAQVNAVQVSLKITALQLLPFTGSREVTAHAISAKMEAPVTAFQVGSQLLYFDDTKLLGGVLGLVGLSVDNLRLLDSDGLASASITPSGLLDLLGVDLGVNSLNLLSPNELANLANVTLLSIIDASIEALGQDAVDLNLAALRAEVVRLNLGNTVIPLWSTATHNGLFASLGRSDDLPLAAASQVQVGLGSLLQTAISIASEGHALEIPGTNVLGKTVQTNLTIVEPPTIAVGPIGTQGKSAQIRVNITIDTNQTPLLGPLLQLLGIRVHLPIAIESVTGVATLDNISCQRMPPSADFRVDANIATITIGKTTDRELVKLGVTLLRGPVSATILRNKQSQLTGLLAGEYPLLTPDDDRYWDYWSAPNELLLGDTLGGLTDAVFQLIGGLFSPPQLDPIWQNLEVSNYPSSSNEQLAQAYLDATAVNGLYNVGNVTNLVLNGQGTVGTSNYIPPLVSSNFSFNNAIPKSCGLLSLFLCPPSNWDRGTFSEAFYAYTSRSYSLLGVVGLSPLGNGYYSCSGLLSALLAWNNCVKANLTELLNQHSQYVNLSSRSQMLAALNNAGTEAVNCPGVVCQLLQPALKPIKSLLNGLGSQTLNPLLDDFLGLELGRVNVEPLAIQCDTGQIVD